MISVKDAIQLVKNNCNPLIKEVVKPLKKSGNYRLYSDVYSPISMPPFRQSAMDGFALNITEHNAYKVIGEIKAGDDTSLVLKPGEAVRIFTGAPVPDTANAVIMQEKVKVFSTKIIVNLDAVSLNKNIRPKGEQVKKGDIALKKDTKLTPAAIGYLSSLGITEVTVYKKPSIAIITTGNELVDGGQKLPYGKIYESNSKMLQNALYNLKFYDLSIHRIQDDYTATLNTLNEITKTKDLVIISGGISVGDYDFVGKALKELNVNQHFYKVMQKPGKPLYFGKRDQATIFALPGNPAAALTCFYMYVYVALQKMTNKPNLELPKTQAKSNSIFNKNGNRPQFLKAIYNNQTVTILEGQSSAMLQTFALSNALVFMPENVEVININDTVEVILLPV